MTDKSEQKTNTTKQDSSKSEQKSNARRRSGLENLNRGNPDYAFTSERQPSPEAKSAGQQRRRFALQLQEEIEQTVEEMLQDPSTDVVKLKQYVSQFPKNIPVGKITAKLLHRDILNPNTKPMERARITEIYNKMAYGDKIDHTSSDGSVVRLADSIASIASKLDNTISEM